MPFLHSGRQQNDAPHKNHTSLWTRPPQCKPVTVCPAQLFFESVVAVQHVGEVAHKKWLWARTKSEAGVSRISKEMAWFAEHRLHMVSYFTQHKDRSNSCVTADGRRRTFANARRDSSQIGHTREGMHQGRQVFLDRKKRRGRKVAVSFVSVFTAWSSV